MSDGDVAGGPLQAIRAELARKADLNWTEAKMEALAKDEEETREIALSARKKAAEPHSCLHENEIRSLAKAVNGWRTVKIGGVFTFVALAAGVIAQYYALTDKTEDTAQAVTDVKASVAEIADEVDEVSRAVDRHIRAEALVDTEAEAEDRASLKMLLREAIEEANRADPRGRSRR